MIKNICFLAVVLYVFVNGVLTITCGDTAGWLTLSDFPERLFDVANWVVKLFAV